MPVDGASRLIERPERFGAVGIEFSEMLELVVWQVRGRCVRPIERAQQGQGVEPRAGEPRAEVVSREVRR